MRSKQTRPEQTVGCLKKLRDQRDAPESNQRRQSSDRNVARPITLTQRLALTWAFRVRVRNSGERHGRSSLRVRIKRTFAGKQKSALISTEGK